MRKATAILLCLVLLTVSGCGQSKEGLLQNAYFGVSYDVADSLITNFVNENNFNPRPETTNTLDNTDKEDNGDGGYFVEMIFTSNTVQEDDENHGQLMIYGEVTGGLTQEEYYQYYRAGYEGNYENYRVEMTGDKEKKLNGVKTQNFTFRVTDMEANKAYMEEYYIYPRGRGCYTIIYGSYWEGQPESEKAVRNMLKAVKLYQ